MILPTGSWSFWLAAAQRIFPLATTGSTQKAPWSGCKRGSRKSWNKWQRAFLCIGARKTNAAFPPDTPLQFSNYLNSRFAGPLIFYAALRFIKYHLISPILLDLRRVVFAWTVAWHAFSAFLLAHFTPTSWDLSIIRAHTSGYNSIPIIYASCHKY